MAKFVRLGQAWVNMDRIDCFSDDTDPGWPEGVTRMFVGGSDEPLFIRGMTAAAVAHQLETETF